MKSLHDSLLSILQATSHVKDPKCWICDLRLGFTSGHLEPPFYWSVYISLWMEFNTGEYFEWCPYNCISTLCRAKDECYDAYRGIRHGSPIGGFAVEQSGGKGGDTK